MRLVWWLLYRNALYGFQMVKLRSDYTGFHHHSANAMFLNLLQQTLSLKCFFVLSSVREGADPFSRLNLCNFSGKCSSLWVCLAFFYNFTTKTFFLLSHMKNWTRTTPRLSMREPTPWLPAQQQLSTMDWIHVIKDQDTCKGTRVNKMLTEKLRQRKSQSQQA